MFTSGQVLQERYQLQHRLGRSPQARQTWLASDSATSPPETVILKLLVFTEMQWHDLRLFEREAQVLKNLNHPRIPQYRDYFLVEQQSHSQLYWWGLVQDHVPGRSLQDLLEQGTRWSEQEVRQIAEEVLQILNYLHGLSPPVLHRDIKPSNLILNRAKQIWLVDFGAVQDQAAVTGVSFTVVGTVGYAPLEQFWGRPVASSDLYALGATLIHLLTGVAPADLPCRDLKIHFSDRIGFRSSFVNWIEKLTEPALEKRFNSVEEAREVLEHGMYSEITPVNDRIQTINSAQSKKIQRIGSHIAVKQTSPKTLKIKLQKASSSDSKNCRRLGIFYFLFGCITCVFLPFIGGFFALVLASILSYVFSIIVIIFNVGNIDPEDINSIRFSAENDYFEVTTQAPFSKKQELGKISAIRYFSITSQVSDNQNQAHTAWAVTIRANRSHTLNWRLTEEECIWLVNEIQNWLDSKNTNLSISGQSSPP
jgi:serine/threonine protein kinase